MAGQLEALGEELHLDDHTFKAVNFQGLSTSFATRRAHRSCTGAPTCVAQGEEWTDEAVSPSTVLSSMFSIAKRVNDAPVGLRASMAVKDCGRQELCNNQEMEGGTQDSSSSASSVRSSVFMVAKRVDSPEGLRAPAPAGLRAPMAVKDCSRLVLCTNKESTQDGSSTKGKRHSLGQMVMEATSSFSCAAHTYSHTHASLAVPCLLR